MPQITGRLTTEERGKFGEYARGLGLDGGTVATLLLIRELRVDRLGTLRSMPELRPPGKVPEKITSHRLAEPAKLNFKRHRERYGLSDSKAVGLLCRAELTERWLEIEIGRK